MMWRIFGFYDSEQEAIKITNSIALKGYLVKDIAIFTKHSSKSSLKKQTDVNINTSVPNEKQINKTFLEKMRNVFLPKERQIVDLHYLLMSYKLSEEKADYCLQKITAGKVLILVYDDLMVGHAPVNEIIRPELVAKKTKKIGY